MSRRRKPTALVLVKVGCAGRGTHKRLVFDTVALSAAEDAEGNPYVAVKHNAGRFHDLNDTNVPDEDRPSEWLVESAGGVAVRTPRVWFANNRYRCPLCKLDFPIRAEREGEIFGKAYAAGVSFLDLSSLSAIVNK